MRRSVSISGSAAVHSRTAREEAVGFMSELYGEFRIRPSMRGADGETEDGERRLQNAESGVVVRTPHSTFHRIPTPLPPLPPSECDIPEPPAQVLRAKQSDEGTRDSAPRRCRSLTAKPRCAGVSGRGPGSRGPQRAGAGWPRSDRAG